MRVLITGGKGFLGGHLLSLLQKNIEIEVRIIERADCDLARDGERLCSLLRDFRPDRIFHLAGRIQGTEQEFLRDNHIATKNLFEAADRSVPDAKIVLGSTTAVYGTGGTAEMPLTEECPASPQGPYARSKYSAEQEAEKFFRRGGWIATARISNPVGPGMNTALLCGTLAQQIVDIERGRPPVLSLRELKSGRDFLAVSDCAQALWQISEQGTAGNIYNVASGTSDPIGEIVEIFVKLARVRPIEIQSTGADSERSTIAEQWLSNARLREIGWQPGETLQRAIRKQLDAERSRA